MNLACKAVLAALARSEYVDADTVVDEHGDPIVTLRSLIRAVSN